MTEASASVYGRSWIEIDRDRYAENLGRLRALLAPDCALMAVVKANAYGHGLEIVAPVAARFADWLGCDSVDEALAIRRLGIDRPLLILGHVPPERADDVLTADGRVALFRIDLAEALAARAVRRRRRARVHLKVETGTHRLGFAEEELGELARALGALGGIEVEGVYTHFANMEDTLDPSYAMSQLRRFERALDGLRAAGLRPRWTHAAATAGALLYPETHFSLVRVGIGGYGIWPSRETRIAARERGREIDLRPVLAWKSRLVQIRRVAAGEPVGYGLTYRAHRPILVGVVPVGYADGYDRKLSNAGRAIVRGRAVPVVGRVAMNMTMLDVSDTGAELDDEVVLLGRAGDAAVSAEDLAERIGTIPYEVVARLSPTLARVAV